MTVTASLADRIIPLILALAPVAVIAFFVVRAIIDPSRMTRERRGPRWQPGYTGLADSGGGVDSGVPDAASGFGDSCEHGSDGGPHGGDCGHGGDGGGSH
jgi:hypothetical protein